MIAEINKNPTYVFLKAFRDGNPVLVRSDNENSLNARTAGLLILSKVVREEK
jgi:hypothetical protein